jgi:hypothetical protein
MVDLSVWHRTNADIRRPVTHALVIGTSRYDYLPENPQRRGALGLSQLDCAAMAAFSIASWLRTDYCNLDAPLATIRLLLSPSLQESGALADQGVDTGLISASTADNVMSALQGWRHDLARVPGSFALLYGCGHGVLEAPDEPYVLLQDTFQHDNLGNALSIAPTQLALGTLKLHASIIFVDACQQIRLDPKYDLTGGRHLAPPKNATPDSRVAAPIYYAAPPGGFARGRAGQGTYFSQALVSCLKSRAARPIDGPMKLWAVTKSSLDEQLPIAVEDLAPNQQVMPAGKGRNFEIHRLPDPPVLPLTISFAPPGAADRIVASLTDGEGKPIEGGDWRSPVDLPCGKYTMHAARQPPPSLIEKWIPIVHTPPTGGDDRVEF